MIHRLVVAMALTFGGQSTPISAADNALEEIVVTAQRRTERLQDVPEAISALSADTIDRLKLQSTEDLVRQIPSLTFDVLGPNEATLTLRGLGTAYGLSPTVAYYFNETPLDTRTDGYSGTPNIDLFDVDRIEVLRGPQGTLYGSSSMGGAIRVLTKQPDPAAFATHAEFGASTTTGGEPGWESKAVVNLPLSADSALRLVGTYQRFGGYVDRAIPASNYLDPAPLDPVVAKHANGIDIYGARIMGRWQFKDGLTLTPSIVYQKSDANGVGDYYSNLPRFTVATYYPEPMRDRLIVGNLLIEDDLRFARLLSSTSIISKYVAFNHDFSVLMTNLAPAFGLTQPFPNFPTSAVDLSDNNGWIQEVRLTSPADARLRWVVGGYYSHFRQHSNEFIDSQAFANAFANLIGAPIPSDPNMEAFNQNVGDTQGAIFGEATYRASDHWELTAGLRFYRLTTELDNSYTGLLAAPNQPLTSARSEGVDPRVVVNYKVTPDTLVYATAARGYRPGGPNVGLFTNSGCTLQSAYRSIYAPDSVWNYEIGAKSQFLNHRVTANLAAYRIYWTDVQQSITDPGCGSLFFANFGTATSTGGEAELVFRPIDSLLLTAGGSFTKAVYRTIDSQFAGAVRVHPGDALADVPRWKYTAAGEYSQPLGSTWTGYVRTDWEHVDAIPTGVTLTATRPAYGIINASIGVRSSRYDVSLYLHNAGNSDAVLFISQGGVYGVSGLFSTRTSTLPRTVGLTFSFSL
jgi:outer membrane receptor protein involved in Fe transport